MDDRFTLLIDGNEARLPARVVGASVGVSPDDVARVLGWELKPQGLCKNDVCIPVRDADGLVAAGRIDLAALAGLLGRPLALDAGEGAACLGSSAQERGARLASLDAPDFTLPDLDGKPHSLSALRGRKVLLVAYASW